MSLTGCRRCFECDAAFPISAQAGLTPVYCPEDGSPLGLELLGRRWRIEAVLGPRVGGGVFIAHHIITGVRAAVSLIYDAKEGELEERLNREVQAQRLLEPHPNLFSLLELGNERDGTRFYVSELQAEQTLREAMNEWRRPSEPMALFAQAGAVLRPILGLLATAHRFGIAHGDLDDSQVYVTISDAPQGAELVLGRPRLYGLRFFAPGPAFVDAVRADLAAMGRLLSLLLFGQLPAMSLSATQQSDLKAKFGEAVGSFLLRTLDIAGSGCEGRFNNIEEMERALAILRRDISVNDPSPALSDCVPIDLSDERTAPNAAPSRMSDGIRTKRMARELTPGGVTPLPELPMQNPLLQKFGFSSELRQVSFADLLAMPEKPPRTEVMARGKSQVSLPEPTAPLLPHLSGATLHATSFASAPLTNAEELEIELISEPSTVGGAACLFSEPTRDLRTQIRPGLANSSREKALVPAASHIEGDAPQAGRFKLWGWWRRRAAPPV